MKWKKTFELAQMYAPIILLVACINSHTVLARQSQSSLYMEVFGGSGLSLPAWRGGTDHATAAQWSYGVTMGWMFDSPLPVSFWIGGTSAYYMLNQYSDVVTGVGNFQGTRWNYFSPSVGFWLGNWVLGLDLEILGRYKFTEPTAFGEEVTLGGPLSGDYFGPIGGRVHLSFPIFESIFAHHIFLGAFYEWDRYTTINYKNPDTSTVRSNTLSTPFNLWQMGLLLSFIL